MFLVNYSSTSESETEENGKEDHSQQLEKKKVILPKASTLLGKRKLPSPDDQVIDDPSQHEGRIRSFKHERGNWATYVFVATPKQLLEDVQEMCLKQLDTKYDFKICTDPHISLSRTVILQYHFIESFVKNLEEELTANGRFTISLSQLKAYTNAERTRTFVAIKVDDIHLEKMLEILKKVDQVMLNFKLATFYEDPSFHISILWCLGDYVDEITKQLPDILHSIRELLPIELRIEKLYCKSGFKEFSFDLK
ncbi:U6 snRNA phosphodiesterase 1 [Musca vetustissima]|uniref:U6 snRNA phosphodiesterase 1 n=1 Tax=Musca vetustissima TaxID=27455 RepID=UPI002AB766D6|nr:U6 snRNA phosphodiesterase 1 [Musca vetustissima]